MNTCCKWKTSPFWSLTLINQLHISSRDFYRIPSFVVCYNKFNYNTSSTFHFMNIPNLHSFLFLFFKISRFSRFSKFICLDSLLLLYHKSKVLIFTKIPFYSNYQKFLSDKNVGIWNFPSYFRKFKVFHKGHIFKGSERAFQRKAVFFFFLERRKRRGAWVLSLLKKPSGEEEKRPPSHTPKALPAKPAHWAKSPGHNR